METLVLAFAWSLPSKADRRGVEDTRVMEKNVKESTRMILLR